MSVATQILNTLRAAPTSSTVRFSRKDGSASMVVAATSLTSVKSKVLVAYYDEDGELFDDSGETTVEQLAATVASWQHAPEESMSD